LAFVVVQLESMGVELVVQLVAADTVDGGCERDRRSILCFWFVGICWCWGGTIFVLFEEVECGLDMVRLFGGWDSGLF
jgi:hypothetical protein